MGGFDFFLFIVDKLNFMCYNVFRKYENALTKRSRDTYGQQKAAG